MLFPDRKDSEGEQYLAPAEHPLPSLKDKLDPTAQAKRIMGARPDND